MVGARFHGRRRGISPHGTLGYLVTMIREWTRGGYLISTDPRRLDLDVIHAFLVRSYWAEEIPRDVMERVDPAPGVYRRAR